MISDDDLDDCFLTDDFAQAAVFTVGGGPVTVSGYFTNGSDAVEQYGVQVEAVEPNITCKTSEIALVTRGTAVALTGATDDLVYGGDPLVYGGDQLVVPGETDNYTVQRIQKVGTGVSVCYLKAA
jgi:hypothetical protein